MRLSQTEIEVISKTIQSLDEEARIRLFGSRADDAKRGGDIDLLILSEKLTESDRGMIRLRLQEKLGEQKIDIAIARDLSDPFVRVAYNEGVEIAPPLPCHSRSAHPEPVEGRGNPGGGIQ